MVTRSELVEHAKSWGYRVTQDQVERWHKKGMLPAPERLPDGKGWAYPDPAIKTLQLALSSTESKRNLNALLLDVWVRGGDVQIEKVRDIFIAQLNIIKRFVRDPFAAYNKFEKILLKRGRPKKSPLPWARRDVVLGSMQLVFHIASPNGSVDVLRPYRDSNTEDESPEDLLYRAMGLDTLPVLDIPSVSEGELLNLHEQLNVARLTAVVNDATATEFEQVRTMLLTVEEWCTLLVTLRALQPKFHRFLGLLEFVLKRHAMFRVSIGALLFLMMSDEELRPKAVDTIAHWEESELPDLRRLSSYAMHLKSHPVLKGKSDWNTFLRNCPPSTLEQLKDHHARYCEQHPDFMEFLGRFQPVDVN